MEPVNAFCGSLGQPTSEQVFATLGKSAEAWQNLVDWLKEEQGVSEQEWKSSSPKNGWSLLLKLKKRTIVYLAPCAGCFRVSLALGDRAVAAAQIAGLSKTILKALHDSPRFAEGTGLRLIVRGERDLPAIRKLARLKLAN
jgi:hypothetical protein